MVSSVSSILLTTGEVVASHARLRPDVIGARDLKRSLTYREWNVRSCRLANALLGLGLERGHRVAILAYNRLEWVEIYVAVAKAGLVAVPINFRLTAPEVGFIIDDCDVAAIIVEDSLTATVDEVRTDLAVAADRFIHIGPSTPPGYRSYEDLVAAGSSSEPAVLVTSDDAWCLMYTSGTTGRPKGAIRSHRGMAMLALVTGVEFRLHRGDVALLVMPMCHANSLNFFTSFVVCGAQIIVFSRPSFDPELCLTALGEATFSSLVPTHYSMMLDVPAAARPGTASIEKLLVSSATAFPETKRRIIEMFPNAGLYELYGSTESGWVTMLHPDEQFEHLGTVGRETVGSAPIRLLDDEGNEVPDGDPGELFSCSPQHFDGYWNRPEDTAAAMRGPYLSVGDVARRNGDGFIELLDRKKNLIVSGGENVYPSEVEHVLADHPDVGDVAVFGVPDAKWSERVAAAIVPRAGTAPSADELAEWTRGRLAGFKRPREFHFLEPDQMPRSATGKILHRRLREKFEPGPTEEEPS